MFRERRGRAWTDGALFPGSAGNEMGAVTMEAGIRVVVGVGRWNSAICHC